MAAHPRREGSQTSESTAERHIDTGSASKRADVRACDWCRRSKLRCDGPERENRVCSRCEVASRECVYTDQVKRSGAPSKSYVSMLEARLAKVEELLSKHCPDLELMRELATISMTPLDRVRSSPSAPPGTASSAHSSSDHESDDSDTIVTKLTDPFRTLGVTSHGYIGASSPFPLVQAMSKMMMRETGSRPYFFRRPKFWRQPDCEQRYLSMGYSGVQLRLPQRELLDQHIEAYFTQVNIFFPLLHRPLFEMQLETMAEDPQFIAVVLLVCACTARSVHCPTATQHGRQGWAYFDQIQPFLQIPNSQPARIYDLQILVLAQIYLATTAQSTSMGWMLLGMSVRMVQQVGAHRRRAYHSSPNLVDELWKRAFWCILNTDRAMSSGLGLPSALSNESFDLDLPLEVDDHCWDLTNDGDNYPLKQTQPPLTPSYLSYLVCASKLHLIHGMALRTLYSNNKMRLMMGFVGPEWEREVLSRLDASLSAWTASLPEHLRWDPNQLDGRWFNQSISLCTAYYHLQILVHNPFMQWSSGSNSAPRSAGSGPNFARSLIICTNSALACTDILATQLRRAATRPDIVFFPTEVPGAFLSAVFLLAVLFGQKSHAGLRAIVCLEPQRVMAAVRSALDTIEMTSRWWNSVMPMWHNLYDLATGHDIPPLPPSTAPPPHNFSMQREPDQASEESRTFPWSAAVPPEVQPKVIGVAPLSTTPLAQSPAGQPQSDAPMAADVASTPQEYLATLPESLQTLLASTLSDPGATALLLDGSLHQLLDGSGGRS